MKVLVVCRGTSGRISPFVREQVDSIRKRGIECDYYLIDSKGIFGYLKNRRGLINKVEEFCPDIIHAHYGLSGLLANLQRRIPVVTTYHGSDINHSKAFRFSKWAIRLSKHNILVSQKIFDKTVKYSKNISLIPCGVDLDLFRPIDKREAMCRTNMDTEKHSVLFASAFSNRVKNSELAKEAVAMLSDVELIELKGYTREQVMCLMNAVDLCLMTSYTEGSPQFIKEAMACNCPIVSVDVGDVSEVIDGVEGCYLTSYAPQDVASNISKAIAFGQKTNGREKLEKYGLELDSVAERVINVYNTVLNMHR